MYDYENIRVLTETNLADMCIKASNVSNGSIVSDNAYKWAKNDYIDWYCKVFDINIPSENLDSEMRALCEKIKKGYVPKNLLIGPTTRPEGIEEFLPAYNFHMFNHQTGMFLDLYSLNPEEFYTGSSVKMIKDEAELKKWLAALNNAFGRERNEEFFKLLLREEDIKLYGYYLHGEVVSAAMAFMKDEVAGIHQVGTVKAHRGNGYASMTVRRAIADARQSGCTIGVLQSSDMGKGIYKAMGFTEYCSISHWEYKGGCRVIP